MANFEHLAQAAAANNFARHAIHRHRPLLRADLQHAVVVSHSVDQGSAFVDVKREGLFGVNVFAGLAGVNAGNNPLKFAGRDDHRVDVLAIEQPAIVLNDGPVGFVLGLEPLGPRQIAVAQADDLRRLGQLLQQETGPATDANRADPNPIIGPGSAGRSDRTWQQERPTKLPGCEGACCSPQKPAATRATADRLLMFGHEMSILFLARLDLARIDGY